MKKLNKCTLALWPCTTHSAEMRGEGRGWGMGECSGGQNVRFEKLSRVEVVVGRRGAD
jgi:hypothetical protein